MGETMARLVDSDGWLVDPASTRRIMWRCKLELGMKVFFEFNGGPRDGELLEGCPEDADVREFDMDRATAHFWETRYGTLGEVFLVRSRYASMTSLKFARDERTPTEHKYRVVNRIDESDAVWVVAQYVGPVCPSQVPEDHKCPWYERLVNLGIQEIVSVHSNFPKLPYRVV